MSKKLDIDSRIDIWIPAFKAAFNNKKVQCPRCGSNRVQMQAKVLTDNKGVAVITCSECGKSGYFSRVDFANFKGELVDLE